MAKQALKYIPYGGNFGGEFIWRIGDFESWLVCQCEEGGPNDVYTVTVKTDRAKTVQSKCNNDLFSFELHLIIDFVLTERKLAHGLVKFL